MKVKKIEEEIINLRTRYPNKSLKEIQNELMHRGFKLSLKYIWSVCKKYGYINKNGLLYDHEYGKTPKKLKNLIKNKRVNINSLPISLIDIEILDKTSYESLKPEHQLFKLPLLFQKISFQEYREKASKLKKLFIKRKNIYFALKAGIQELLALNWLKLPKEELKVAEGLEKFSPKDKDIKFLIFFHKAHALLSLLRYDEANKYIKKCKKMCYNSNYASYYRAIGTLYTSLYNYKWALKYYLKALKTMKQKDISLFSQIALCYNCMGNYTESIKWLRKIKKENGAFLKLVESLNFFNLGKFEVLYPDLEELIEYFSKEFLLNYFHIINLLLANVYIIKGQRKQALYSLTNSLPVFKEHNPIAYTVRKMLLEPNIEVNKELLKFPLFKLLFYLKKGDLKNLYRFAERKGLKGIIPRYALFFPNIWKKVKDREKFLDFFIKPFLTIYIFDDFKIKKDHAFIKEKLFPREKSLLLYLALSNRDEIPIEEIINSYWPKSKNPIGNVYRYFYLLRKKLNIPKRFLKIIPRKKILKCEVKFSTDWEIIKKHYFEGEIFYKLEKYKEARESYARAFSFIKKAPFYKMYDRFSEDTRTKIIIEIYSMLEKIKEKDPVLYKNIEKKLKKHFYF